MTPYTQHTADGYSVILDRRRAHCPACRDSRVDRVRCVQGGEHPLPRSRLFTSDGGRDPPPADALYRAMADCIGKVTIDHRHGICRACGETWLERV